MEINGAVPCRHAAPDQAANRRSLVIAAGK
jgi:hypothetical protein